MMNSIVAEKESARIGAEQLMTFVRGMIGGVSGRPDDDNPLPPGPWGPVIRLALERAEVFGPSPEPWARGGGRQSYFRSAEPQPVPWKLVVESILARHPELFDAIGGGHSLGDEASLNPQPLPPRYRFLLSVAQVVAERAELFQEISDASSRDGAERGIIIVGGYLARFADDVCGNGFRWKWPFPGPRPHWFDHELDAVDLMVLATQFNQAAKQAYSPELSRQLARASAKFGETGVSRLN